MSYKIYALNQFKKDVKRLQKRYKYIKDDLKTLNKILQNNPKEGIRLFSNVYKIRVQNSSINKGKSGGFRVIYYYIDKQKNIYLLSIYSKSDLANISDKKILQILKNELFGEK